MISFIVMLSIVVCFSAILALALNFQWGLGGLVNFGLAGFYTLGAYTCAMLILKGGANTFFATLGAMAIVAAACALTAFVTLRVAEEDYFAIVTLGVGGLYVLPRTRITERTIGTLIAEGRPPTPEEQQTLARVGREGRQAGWIVLIGLTIAIASMATAQYWPVVIG